ncbi:MAG: hypothetical protein JWQ02_1150 [Capsulimonas sp.]|jgi:hypothetical protein|nr:hypothetical protein [Capsulimonas sp.]
MKFSLFAKPILTVEQQLTDLAACGLPLSPRVTIDDLFTVATREDMERNPFDHLVAALGFTKEDEADTPLCDNLWMCDFQCIHDHGDYVKIIERFRVLCHRRLWFENVSDFVETEFNKAWVEFDVDGDRVHWNAVVQDDWLDPFLLKKLDLLLAEHTNLRIYSNTADFGQSALLGCFTNEEFERFHQISHIPFLPLAQQS